MVESFSLTNFFKGLLAKFSFEMTNMKFKIEHKLAIPKTLETNHAYANSMNKFECYKL